MSVPIFGGPTKYKVAVTCKHTKKISDDKIDTLDHLTAKEKAFTLNDDVKLGLISRKDQEHICTVRKQNIELYTHTERLRKEHDHFIRQVRQTGVTLVTNQARNYGFGNPEEADIWANFGQGAPECGPIPGGPKRDMTLTLDEETLE